MFLIFFMCLIQKLNPFYEKFMFLEWFQAWQTNKSLIDIFVILL